MSWERLSIANTTGFWVEIFGKTRRPPSIIVTKIVMVVVTFNFDDKTDKILDRPPQTNPEGENRKRCKPAQ
jgi:hypothetical protein